MAGPYVESKHFKGTDDDYSKNTRHGLVMKLKVGALSPYIEGPPDGCFHCGSAET